MTALQLQEFNCVADFQLYLLYFFFIDFDNKCFSVHKIM